VIDAGSAIKLEKGSQSGRRVPSSPSTFFLTEILYCKIRRVSYYGWKYVKGGGWREGVSFGRVAKKKLMLSWLLVF